MPTRLDRIPTPALIVDRSRLTENIRWGAELASRFGVRLRPHVKTHKCPAVARLQSEAGAIGLTAATLNEVEAFAEAGTTDFLLAYPVVGGPALSRFAALSRRVRLAVAVDHPDHVTALGKLAANEGIHLPVRLEIDCGHHRCGLPPGNGLVALARQVAATPGLELEGVFSHAGHAYAAASPADLATIGRQEGEAVVLAARMIREAGLPCPVVSAGSTPTLPYCSAVPGVTEVRPGNYVFFDVMQVALGVVDVRRCALSVLATVIGLFEDRFVMDAGSKAVGLDKGAHGLERVTGFGLFPDHPDWLIERLSEEHGVVRLGPGATRPRIGDRVSFLPNHACAAVNLHGRLFLRGEDGTVVGEEPVVGRR